MSFDGFADHVTAGLGEVERVEPAETAAGDRGYDLVFLRHPELDVMSVVSNGLRFAELDGPLPEELVCSVRAAQADAAPGARGRDRSAAQPVAAGANRSAGHHAGVGRLIGNVLHNVK